RDHAVRRKAPDHHPQRRLPAVQRQHQHHRRHAGHAQAQVRLMRALPAVACALLVSLLGACVQPPTAPSGLMDVAERPAEKALLAGIRAYEDAQYAEAEKQLNAALAARLASAK